MGLRPAAYQPYQANNRERSRERMLEANRTAARFHVQRFEVCEEVLARFLDWLPKAKSPAQVHKAFHRVTGHAMFD